MNDSPEAVFVLLSDLHFGADFHREADLPPLDFPWSVRLFDKKIRRFIENRCGAHDMDVVAALPRYLTMLLQDLQNRGFYRDSFDLYVLGGDLATWPSESSYKFIRNYLTSEEYQAENPNIDIICAGLAIDPNRIVAIPGNHDKLLHANLDLYSRYLTAPLGLPYKSAPQECSIYSRSVGGRNYLFILVEASRYAAENLRLDAACRDHMAGGIITRALRDSICQRLDQLELGQEVDGVCLEDFQSALKILIVHYAVDDLVVAGSEQALQGLILPHECVGLGELIESLRTRIHLVIHGHLHRPQLYNHKGVPVVAVSTTTQKRGENGFFLLTFSKSGAMRAELHSWNGVAFARDPRGHLSLSLEPAASLSSP